MQVVKGNQKENWNKEEKGKRAAFKKKKKVRLKPKTKSKETIFQPEGMQCLWHIRTWGIKKQKTKKLIPGPSPEILK